MFTILSHNIDAACDRPGCCMIDVHEVEIAVPAGLRFVCLCDEHLPLLDDAFAGVLPLRLLPMANESA